MPQIFTFAQIDDEDASLVGFEGTKLGKMARLGLPTPTGFVVSSLFFEEFLATNDLAPKIKKLVDGRNFIDPYDFLLLSKKIEEEFDKVQIESNLKKEISRAWQKIAKIKHSPFIVYPSCACETDNGFFGSILEPYTIFSERELLIALKGCWKSQFGPSLLSTYHDSGFAFSLPKIAVVVQEMVSGDVSGNIMTHNAKIKNTCLIYAIWGLYDESLFNKNFSCDLYMVDLRNLEITDEKIGRQEIQSVRVGNVIKELPISLSSKSTKKLNDEKIKSLAKLAKQVVEHYFFPQRIRWSMKKNRIFILDLGPQIIEPAPKVDVQVPEQSKEIKIPIGNLQKVGERTATKILLHLKSDKELESWGQNLGDGVVLQLSNFFNPEVLTWSDIYPKLKLLCAKIAPKALFFQVHQNPSEIFATNDLSQNRLWELGDNLVFVFPAPLWSESFPGLVRQLRIPVWVSCDDTCDLPFLEQYILWGAKGILVDSKSQTSMQSLESEGDGTQQPLWNIVAKTSKKHNVGTGLALDGDTFSFDSLRLAVFSGLSHIVVPYDSYYWAQQEIKSAEHELLVRRHG